MSGSAVHIHGIHHAGRLAPDGKNFIAHVSDLRTGGPSGPDWTERGSVAEHITGWDTDGQGPDHAPRNPVHGFDIHSRISDGYLVKDQRDVPLGLFRAEYQHQWIDPSGLCPAVVRHGTFI